MSSAMSARAFIAVAWGMGATAPRIWACPQVGPPVFRTITCQIRLPHKTSIKIMSGVSIDS